MSFLSQTFLFALPLALVPIVLHLINRQQREVVHWGAMQFLTDATAEGIRYQRVEELLLLACRVGLVLALVMALARPLLKSSVFGTSAQRDVVVLLDNSLSTDLQIGDSTVFDQMKDRMQRALNDLSAGDQVRVMLTAGDSSWLQSEPIMRGGGGFTELKKRIAQSQPTLAKTSVRQALQSVLDSFVDEPGKNLPRSIILLTDGQAEGWEPESTTEWQQLAKVMGSPQDDQTPISLQVIFPDEVVDSVSNIAVAEIASRSNLVPNGEKVAFQTRVINTGNSDQFDISLHWTINGERHKEATIDKLSAGESRELEWSTRLESNGCVRVGCELDPESVEDQLGLDNSVQKIIEVADRIPVLLVRADSSYGTSAGHVFFSSALGHGPSVSDDSWRSVYEPTTCSIEDLDTQSFSDYHSIILSDTGPLPSHLMEQVTDYVHEGGGLWVALGGRADIAAFNAAWYDEGTGLCPWQLTDLVTQDGNPAGSDADSDSSPPMLIHQPDQHHPATATLAKTSQVDLDDVQIRRRHAFSDENELRPISSLLETSRGEPLVVENAFGQGRIIVQTFPLGNGWTNLPITRAYVVMIHDWLAYLTQPAATQYNLEPIAPIRLPRLSASTARSITVRPPVGEPLKLSNSDLKSVSKFHYGRTSLPGCYEVDVDSNQGKTTHFFQVKRDAIESRLKQLSNEQREMFQACLGAGFGGEPETAATATAAATAMPTWSWFLIALLILVVAEQFLASRLNQNRFGTA